MDTKISCPHCQQPLEVPKELLGQTVECPTCHGHIKLPKSDLPVIRNVWVAPGKKFLKVIGIIGLILCGITCVTVMIELATGETTDWNDNTIAVNVPYSLWTLAVTCYYTYIYLMGVIHCATLEKASFLKRLGIISITLCPFDYLVGTLVEGPAVLALLPIDITVITLYLVGASKNEAAFKARR